MNNSILEFLNEIKSVNTQDDEIDEINLLITNKFKILTNLINIKPIPIKYYNNNLIRISTNQNCVKCNKLADFKLSNTDIILCWSHSHSYSDIKN